MWTPLQYACASGNIPLTKDIMEKHPDLLEARGNTSYAYTPLHIAARYGHTKVIEKLLFYGANLISTEAQSGCTALHFAAAYGHIHAIQLLLSAESVAIKTHKGSLAIDLARENGYFHASNLIMSSMRHYETSLQLHSWLASIALIEHASAFESAGLTDPACLLLHGISQETLVSMNISKIGHRQKLASLYGLREFLKRDSSDSETESKDEEAIDTQDVSQSSSEVAYQ